MLKSKNQDNKKNSNASQNRIAQGTEIEGDITSKGGFRIDGLLKGSLKTDGKVVIGKDGKILGTLICSNADIEGAFEGDMTVENLLSLKATAVVNGEVVTAKLMVEPGTEFNGSCTMNQGVKKLDTSKEDKKSGKTA